MRFRVDPRQEEIRQRARACAAKGSAAQLELAWNLGGIAAEALYRGWRSSTGQRFRTLGEWVAHDIAEHVSKSKAQRLALAGVIFRGEKERIDRLVAEGKVGISRLCRLASLIRDHEMTLADAIAALEDRRVLPAEALGRFPTDVQVRIYLDYPTDIGPEVRRGLTYLALRSGASSIEEAVAALARDAATSAELPASLAPYRRLIDQGAFRCRVCGKLPLDPAIATVGGVDVLLCRAPCWSPLVESDQAKYAAKWRANDRRAADAED